MPEIVYRVQDKDGRGPFRPGFSHLWGDADPRADKRPSIIEEVGTTWARLRLYGEHMGCACRTLGELLRWFSAAELERLRTFGFHVVEMPVDRLLVETQTQVVFGRARPLNEDIRFIPWRDFSHAQEAIHPPNATPPQV